jgi:hypothetical protein
VILSHFRDAALAIEYDVNESAVILAEWVPAMGRRIEIVCPGCEKLLSFKAEYAGDVGVCSACDTEVPIADSSSKMRECPDCNRMVSRRATECPKCGCPLKASLASKLGSVAHMPGVDRMPSLKTRKSPVLAFIIGCCFGCIGTGLYFRTFLDFFVPFVVFIVLSIAGVGIGGVPGWLFAGAWGLFRALDANRRLDLEDK